MKRVLAGFIMDGRSGGIDKYLLNFLENVRGDDVGIDFLTNEIDPELESYLRERKSRIFAIASLKHPVKQYRQVCKIIEQGRYDIVYLNISTAIDCAAAWAAKKMRVNRILLHSHSSGNDIESALKRKIFDIIHYICRLTLYRTATDYYGCSKKAGLWMFPAKIVESPDFSVIFNAVDTGRFQHNVEIREEIRDELGITDQFVVGHVGNFVYQKNHFFLIDVFEALKKRCPEAVLLLVGTGVRFEQVKETVREKGLEDSVKLLGFRKDADRLFQGMDFFVLPSNFEGLPTVGVEAQCAGLPCLMSDTITDEAKITGHCWFLSLKKSPEEWASFILSHRQEQDREAVRIGEGSDYSLEQLKKQQKYLLYQ